MWISTFGAVIASFLVTGGVIAIAAAFPRIFMDSADGPQKFHGTPTPRVGGIGIFAGFLLAVAFVAIWTPMRDAIHATLTVVACSLLVFAVGLVEDITKRVGVMVRLGGTMAAGVLAFYFADARLTRLDVGFLDQLLTYRPIALVMTAVAVAGIANAVNIVDGYNGLSGGFCLLALGAIAYVANGVGDAEIMLGSLILGGAITGFLIWNFPLGRIFMGDAGAYFVGFMLAEWSILLVHRHADVSPWFPLLVTAYPVWETLFSIYRKRFVRGTSPGQPDGLHFHMMVYKRVVRWRVGSNNPVDKRTRNSLTAPYLWGLAALPIAAGVAFWNDSLVLAIAGFAFGGVYNMLYRQMVFFRVPSWVVLSDAIFSAAAHEEAEDEATAT